MESPNPKAEMGKLGRTKSGGEKVKLRKQKWAQSAFSSELTCKAQKVTLDSTTGFHKEPGKNEKHDEKWQAPIEWGFINAQGIACGP